MSQKAGVCARLTNQGLGKMLTSIRSRLIILVLLLTLPSAVIFVWMVHENRTLALQESVLRLHDIAEEAKQKLQSTIMDAQRLHAALVRQAEVAELRTESCISLPLNTNGEMPEYTALYLYSSRGEAVCNQATQLGVTVGMSEGELRNAKFFQRALKQEGLVVEILPARKTNEKSFLVIATALRSHNATPNGVLFTTYELDQFSEQVNKRLDPDLARIELNDKFERLVYSYPFEVAADASTEKPRADASSNQARPHNASAILQRVLTVKREVDVLDQKMFSLRIKIEQPNYYFAIRKSFTNIWYMVLGLVVIGFVAAWWIGNRLMLKSIQSLVGAAMRFSAGDYQARVGAPYAKHELGILAQIFDTMAESAAQNISDIAAQNSILDLRVQERTADLLAQQARLSLALEAGRLGMWDRDLIAETTTSSTQHARVFGYDSLPAGWNSETFLTHVYNEDRNRVATAYRNALETGRFSEEFRVQWQDGSIHWLSDMGQVFYDANGRAYRMIGVVSEITTRKLLEASMRSSENRFREILETAADGMVISDHRGVIILINKEAERLFSIERAQILGQAVDELLPPNLEQEIAENDALDCDDIMVCGQKAIACRRADGSEFLAEIQLTNIELDGQTMKAATIRDVSARVHAEREIKRLNRTLRVLSHCNEILVRAEEEQLLIDTVSQALVQKGGYPMAWIGLVGEEKGPLKVAALAYEQSGVVDLATIHWGQSAPQLQLVQALFNDGCAQMISPLTPDFQIQSAQIVFHNDDYVSLILVPLRSKAGLLGALGLYTRNREAFDAQEVELLQELADDIGYGLMSLRETDVRHQFERRLHYQENFDALTGLPSRRLLANRLAQAILQEGRNNKQVAIIHLTIDRFQLINDSLGHAFGDELLKTLAARLSTVLGESDTVGRLSSYDFGIVVGNLTVADDVRVLLDQITRILSDSFTYEFTTVYVTASVGVSIFPPDGDEAELLLQHADAAMLSAKNLGGNAFQFYSADLHDQMARRMAIEAELRLALERKEFEMYFQPKVSLKTGEVTGAEALIRWENESLGSVSPTEFIPLAEDTGLIFAIGAWTLEMTCQKIGEWRAAGIEPIPISVNLSARQFRQENLLEMIQATMERYQLDPALLVLEITESTAMVNVEGGIKTLTRLKELGIKLAIDDFGTGYSSLNNLKRLPLDQLKIDRTFVRDITTDPDDRAICLAIIGLAHTLKMSVVAEGVESEAQMNILLQHHCDELQGFLFSQAVSHEEFAQLLKEKRCLSLPVAPAEKEQTILLVDDEQNILSALKRLLRRDQYRILTATSGAEGLEILAQNHVDVIMSDQRMPGMIGADFLRRAKELYPATIRIMLSGYTELQSVTDAVNEGAIYKFLTKPWEDELLRMHIREAFKLKNIDDENTALNEALLKANDNLAETNRKIEELLERRNVQITRAEVNLNIVREVLQKIPFAVIGLDDEYLIVFVNDAASRLFDGRFLLGCELQEGVPELMPLTQAIDGEIVQRLNIAEEAYRAMIHPMGGASGIDDGNDLEVSGMLVIFQKENS